MQVALLPGHGYIPLLFVGATIVNAWAGVKVNAARKKFGIEHSQVCHASSTHSVVCWRRTDQLLCRCTWSRATRTRKPSIRCSTRARTWRSSSPHTLRCSPRLRTSIVDFTKSAALLEFKGNVFVVVCGVRSSHRETTACSGRRRQRSRVGSDSQGSSSLRVG